MTTTINIIHPSDEKLNSDHEQYQLLRPPSVTFKPFPSTIIKSIENDRLNRISHSTSDFRNISQTSLLDNDETAITKPSNQNHLVPILRQQRLPLDVRIKIDDETFDDNLSTTTSHMQLPLPTYLSEKRNSESTIIGIKNSKLNRVDHLRRVFLDHRFGRRIHSSFSSASSTTLRSFNRRRSTPNCRRQTIYLPRSSKWHFVRHHLHDIAMMNDTYARMKLVEQDLRWKNLREHICKQVLDMREMELLRQQDDGKLKKSFKTSFDLKSIPIDEVVHVERDGRVYSIGTRDLVLGRLIGGDDDIQLDTFAQLDARRKFQVKQNLLRQQEGRNRLKKYIAFSFCLCNLSFIALMFAAMFIFAMKTLIELKSSQVF